MKKIFIALLFVIFITSFISAISQINQSYNITLSCQDFTCEDLNITILYPNATPFIINLPMTNYSDIYAYYSFTPTIKGNYTYFYTDGANIGTGCLLATNTGYDLSLPQMLLYFFIGTILILLFILCLYGGINIKFKNVRNNEEEVIKINWLKYLKIFCWGFFYVLLIALVFVTWTLTWSYSDWNSFSKFLEFLLRLLYALFLPVLFLILLMTIINLIDDNKVNKFIQKTGLPYRKI